MLESNYEFSYKKVANAGSSVIVFIVCVLATEDDKVGSSFR